MPRKAQQVLTLYVVVSGEEGEGQAPLSIHLDQPDADKVVAARRAHSLGCDLTYIEVWKREPDESAFKMRYTIPADPHNLGIAKARGTR